MDVNERVSIGGRVWPLITPITRMTLVLISLFEFLYDFPLHNNLLSPDELDCITEFGDSAHWEASLGLGQDVCAGFCFPESLVFLLVPEVRIQHDTPIRAVRGVAHFANTVCSEWGS